MANNKLTYITSRDNPLLVRLRKLARHPADYRKQRQVLLEGEHLCQAWAVRGAALALHAVMTESAWREGRFLELAEAAAATVIVSDAAMADLSTLDTPVPVAFVVALPEQPAIQADVPTVVLDRIQDAGNVGSILRSAAAFGFCQVIALRGTASLWSPKVLRAAMGAHFGLRLIEAADPAGLGALAVPILMTSSHHGQFLHQATLPWPCAWALGHEGQGVGEGVGSQASQAVRIAQPGGEESLNVACAAAICLHASATSRG